MCVEQKVSCSCTCPPNSFERSDHIVFVSQIVRARTISCAKRPPRLAQVYGIVSELLRAYAQVVWHVSRGNQLRHIPYGMCQPGRGLCTSFSCARTIWGNPKLWPLRSNACAFLRHLHFLFHTEPPITRVWDRSDLAQNDGNMSTRENRELWGETKQHRGMEDFLVRRIRSRNEVPLTLICSTSSEISQRGRIM